MPRKNPATGLVRGFGRAVRERREALGLSQEELGFNAELDRTYISGIERGVRNPTLMTMGRIARALDLQLSGLVRSAEERGAR